jgi:Ca2+-binding EF-hand superfamily protein
MNFLNDLNKIKIPPDLINIANDISNQIEQSGINLFPGNIKPQEIVDNINTIQTNVQTGLEMMNKINELFRKFDRDGDGAITQNGHLKKKYPFSL